MKYVIEPVNNGYIFKEIDFEEETVTVFQNFMDLLRELNSIENPGSRYDSKRTYIIEAPGDKHEKFTNEHAKVIWGEDS